MQRKIAEMRRSVQGKIAFAVYFGLLLVGTCLPMAANALPVVHGQAFRAANGKRPISNVVSSLFGGSKDAFQGDTKTIAEINVAGLGP